MAKYFTIAELTASDTAKIRGIDNTPPAETIDKLEALANKLLDPIRILWGKPLYVNSGYRSPELNKAVGGVSTSQHVKGEAADITAGSPAENKKLFEMICTSSINYDQLIDESDYAWIHISYREQKNRNQILHL